MESWTLPERICESSGIAPYTENSWITFNDSGNTPSLFIIKAQTKSKELDLEKVIDLDEKNFDWEAICPLSTGGYAVGDFGNNLNKRQNLKIILLNDSLQSNGIIPFSYADQHLFPPSTRNMNFDSEAMISYEGMIYIFTKDRSNPFTGNSWIYLLDPTNRNHQSLIPLDSIHMGKGFLKPRYRITDASISENGKYLALLSVDRLWIYDASKFPHIDKPIATKKFLGKSGREGALLSKGNKILVTSEKYKGTGGKFSIYKYKGPESW